MAIDIPNNNIYDVADRNSWLNNGTLVSTIPGVSLYGPLPVVGTNFVPFAENVTDALTGTFYTFQPFADQRIRLAFADSVNMSAINEFSNNNLGQNALNVIPPPVAPNGIYNSSVGPTRFQPDRRSESSPRSDDAPDYTIHARKWRARLRRTLQQHFRLHDSRFQRAVLESGKRSVTLTYDAGDTVYEDYFHRHCGRDKQHQRNL